MVQTLKRTEPAGDCCGTAILSEIHGYHAKMLYMQRYCGISLNPNPVPRHYLVLAGKGNPDPKVMASESTPLESFNVYMCVPEK